MASQPVYSRKSLHYRLWRNTYRPGKSFCSGHKDKEDKKVECTWEMHLPKRPVGRCRYWERIIWGNLLYFPAAYGFAAMMGIVILAFLCVVGALYMAVYVVKNVFGVLTGIGYPIQPPFKEVVNEGQPILGGCVHFSRRVRLAIWGAYLLVVLYLTRAYLPAIGAAAVHHSHGPLMALVALLVSVALGSSVYFIVTRVKRLRQRARQSAWLAQVGECLSEFWAFAKDRWRNEVCPIITFVD